MRLAWSADGRGRRDERVAEVVATAPEPLLLLLLLRTWVPPRARSSYCFALLLPPRPWMRELNLTGETESFDSTFDIASSMDGVSRFLDVMVLF